MVAADHLYLLIKSEGDQLYVDHLGYIVYESNTNESLESTLECINLWIIFLI